MADQTVESSSPDYSWVIPILAGLLSGQSATGQSAGTVSTTGPLTPEGRQIWDQYTKMLGTMPDSRNINFGGQKFNIPNYQKVGLLKALLGVDKSRNNSLTPQAAQTGWLGKLAPLLAQVGGGSLKDIWKLLAGSANNNPNIGLTNTDIPAVNGSDYDWLSGVTDTGTGAADTVSSGADALGSFDWLSG